MNITTQFLTRTKPFKQKVHFAGYHSIISYTILDNQCYSFSNNLLGYKKKAAHVSYYWSNFLTQNRRSMATTKDEATLRDKYKPRDIKFKTPYGHIGALEWGHSTAPFKILCSHGWLDNAGSFERLIPFILDHKGNANRYHIVSMDHPGVGLSSHLPPGARYDGFTTLIEMKRISQELKWEKMTLLSHSLGSHLSFLYSCIYPKQIENMISIDLTHPLSRQVHHWNISMANSIEDILKNDALIKDPTGNGPPVYSKADAIKRLMDGHSASLNRESAEVMMKRGAREQNGGFVFNRDVRLRHLTLEWRPDDELLMKFFKNTFQANLLVVRAKVSPFHRPESVRLAFYELFEQQCPVFKDIALDGTHHLHMNNPDTVAAAINEFLDDVQSKNLNPVVIKKSNL